MVIFRALEKACFTIRTPSSLLGDKQKTESAICNSPVVAFE